jgi:hypothetical protein
MALTPDEQAEFARLSAKMTEPDPDPAPVVGAAGEVAADVGAATAEAVGEAAAAAASAVADQTPDVAPVVIEAPDPIEQATAAAIVIDAEATADVQRIEAVTDAELRIRAADEDQADDGAPVGDLLDETFGPIVEELAPDAPPKPVHGWWRTWGSK